MLPAAVNGCGRLGIDRLARQHLHGLPVVVGQFVMRQVWMKVEGGHIIKQPELIEISESSQRCDVARAFDQCGPQTPTVPSPESQAPSATNARRN